MMPLLRLGVERLIDKRRTNSSENVGRSVMAMWQQRIGTLFRRLIASEVTGSQQPIAAVCYREEADNRTGVREVEIRARLGCARMHAMI